MAVRERVRKGASFADALARIEISPDFTSVWFARARFGGPRRQRCSGSRTISRARWQFARRSVGADLSAAAAADGGRVVLSSSIYVLPEFESLFADAGKSLPLADAHRDRHRRRDTRLWLAGGDRRHRVLAVCFRQAIKREDFRYQFDPLVMRLPLFWPPAGRIDVERLMRTFGMLLRAACRCRRRWRMSKEVVANTALARALGEAATGLREAKDWRSACRRRECFRR